GAGHLEVVERKHAGVDASGCADTLEGETLREHVAEIEGNAPRQRLQAHQRNQLPEARLDLQKLALVRLQVHGAGEARVIERNRLAVPGEITLEQRRASFDETRIADAIEEGAGVVSLQREVERAARR